MNQRSPSTNNLKKNNAMKKLYVSLNFIIYSVDGLETNYQSKDPYYREDGYFKIEDSSGRHGTLIITDPTEVFDEAGAVAFTEETMTAFFRENSGKYSGGATPTPTPVSKDYSVIVNQSNYLTTICGTIDSTKEYFLDGVIDLGASQITVPPNGLNLRGYNLDISGLKSSADNYTMFVSESIVIGSGDFLGMDYFIEASGAGSKVYELYDATGFNAIEVSRVNYNNCTSLGDLYDYRQGLELGTGRFGGSPSLTLHGLWRGGFRITTSIVRNLAGTMTEPLFKEGFLFQMNSRFLTDINVDLPTLAPFMDFDGTHFPNPSTIQFKGMEVTRDGVYDSDDSNLTPNISASHLSCDWRNNNGLPNTYVGANVSIVTETTTNIVNSNTWYDLEGGSWLPLDLQHFEYLADGKLKHLGNTPRDFEVSAQIVLEGNRGDSVSVKFRKWDESAGAFVELDYTTQTRVINNLQGARDVSYFNILTGVTLDKGDYLFMQVKNITDSGNVTAESSSFFRVQER